MLQHWLPDKGWWLTEWPLGEKRIKLQLNKMAFCRHFPSKCPLIWKNKQSIVHLKSCHGLYDCECCYFYLSSHYRESFCSQNDVFQSKLNISLWLLVGCFDNLVLRNQYLFHVVYSWTRWTFRKVASEIFKLRICATTKSSLLTLE